MELSSDLSGAKEFTIVKRGYDPDEVNAFLDQIATGVGELKRKLAAAESEARQAQASPAPEAGRTLLTTPGLRRNPSLRVHVSGCPNSCAQHQAGDIGLAGTKVRLGGAVRLGYHLYLGADLATGRIGEVVGRMAADDVPAVVDAVIGTWEAHRHGSESLADTFHRLGADTFAATLESVLDDRWATGPEPDGTADAGSSPVDVRTAPAA